MKSNNIVNLGIIGAGITIGAILADFCHPAISGDSLFRNIRKLEIVMGTAAGSYVDDVNTDELTEAAIQAMLEKLDPHSVYISARRKAELDEEFQGQFTGIGIQFEVINDTPTVVHIFSNGPADNAGIMIGDRLVKADSTLLIGLNEEDIVNSLRGMEGSKVQLSLLHPDNKSSIISVKRAKIPLKSVESAFIIQGTDIGYISLTRFISPTYAEFIQALEQLQQQGMKKLMLDLRGNPGGYLDQAVKIADEFIGGTKKIVYTKGKKAEYNEEFFSSDGNKYEQIPLVVLLNSGSASASEILAGAIQDLDRGVIVGETSFGKGLVQKQFSLPDGAAYRITTSRYYTPSGRSIQRPYNNKEEYYALEGRTDGTDGDNFQHDAEFDTARPKFFTQAGRTVFGGGGIVPDFIVHRDTTSSFHSLLQRKNLYREVVLTPEFSSLLLKIRSQFKDSFESFNEQYMPGDKEISMLKKYTENKKIAWSDTRYGVEQKLIATTLKSFIAQRIWGNEAFARVQIFSDKQVLQAIELFPKAGQLAQKTH